MTTGLISVPAKRQLSCWAAEKQASSVWRAGQAPFASGLPTAPAGPLVQKTQLL